MSLTREQARESLAMFLCRIARTVDADGLLILRDPALGDQIPIPARALLRLCAMLLNDA